MLLATATLGSNCQTPLFGAVWQNASMTCIIIAQYSQQAILQGNKLNVYIHVCINNTGFMYITLYVRCIHVH